MNPINLTALINKSDTRACGLDESTACGLPPTLQVSSVEYRSDNVLPGSLFCCVVGGHSDGHDFAADAAARGAVALVVQRPLPIDLPQLCFKDTRMALAQLSAAFYARPSASLSIAAVTGTNGKTTTAYLVDWISDFCLGSSSAGPSRTGLIGTVETRIGYRRLPSKYTTPESADLQRLLAEMRDSGVSHVSMEASSHAIAQHRLAAVDFAVAGFSNLTQDHLDYHGSMEAYFDAKATLFDWPWVRRRAINIDSDAGRQLVLRCQRQGFEVLTCGLAESADVSAEGIEYHSDHTRLSLRTPEGSFALSYPLIGGFNVSNLLLAAAMASELGFSWPDIVAALSSCPQVPGRMERVLAQGIAADDPGQPPIQVFVDYSHTPDSIAKALEALAEIPHQRTLIVFGCGGDRDTSKRPLMGQAAMGADFAVVTSDNPRSEVPLDIIDDILAGIRGQEPRYTVEPDRRLAIALALANARSGDFVLIAGKGHEDYQLVGSQVLDFDDRLVAAEELRRLAGRGHWPAARPDGGQQAASDWPAAGSDGGQQAAPAPPAPPAAACGQQAAQAAPAPQAASKEGV
jgi:UDP-N-acetylmuramoyl-L-alanyl-D-glutamate--2,6-diaminopimelate ligase